MTRVLFPPGEKKPALIGGGSFFLPGGEGEYEVESGAGEGKRE